MKATPTSPGSRRGVLHTLMEVVAETFRTDTELGGDTGHAAQHQLQAAELA